jgi:hypothetical protein
MLPPDVSTGSRTRATRQPTAERDQTRRSDPPQPDPKPKPSNDPRASHLASRSQNRALSAQYQTAQYRWVLGTRQEVRVV